MASTQVIEAALSWGETPAEAAIRELDLAGSPEGFGLLERGEHGWTLAIPDGAVALVDGEVVDLSPLPIDPSGERHVPVQPGLHARIVMGSFAFSVRPS